MNINGYNIRVTDGKLWYPRKDKAVTEMMDRLYERTSPNEMMWNENKPVKEYEPEPEPIVEREIFSLADDMDLDGELDEC